MALSNLTSFALSVFISLNGLALDCRLIEKFSDPKFANNTKFWDDLGKINSESDEAVAALIKKHDSQFKFSSSSNTASKNFHIPEAFNVSKKSEKALKTLNPTQKKNFEEFVQAVNGKDGVKALYNNPGKWHFEKLKQYGGSSVRLDQGVRVLFKVDGDKIDIMDIGNHIGH